MEFKSPKSSRKTPQEEQTSKDRPLITSREDIHRLICSNSSETALNDKIIEINRQAYRQSQLKDYNAALSKLKQGEQILEYAAQSCRNIKRQLIIVVLHNIVCISQSKWDLPTASDYLQGLIYNLQIDTASKLASKLTEDDTPIITPNQNASHQQIMVQLQLVQYYLQYCAINSQLRKHKNSLLAVRKALKLVAPILQISLKQHKKMYEREQMELVEGNAKCNLVRFLLESKLFFAGQNGGDRSNILNFSHQIWKNQCLNHKKHALSSQMKLLSIGNIMTLTFKQMQGKHIKHRLQDSIVYLHLIASMTYFSLATELKLSEECPQAQLNEARHYHSLSIMLYQLLVPFQAPYLQHIRDNYIKNYGEIKQNEQISKQQPTYKDLAELMRKQSVLQGSLQQQSVNTIQQEKRKNQRLKQQNLRLKYICMNQNKVSKPLKPNNSHKSYQKNTKSMTMSSHNNHKKLSVDMRYDSSKLAKSKNKINTTDFQPSNPSQNENYYSKKTNRTHKKKKQNKQIKAVDDIQEKYYDLAFKKAVFKSPKMGKTFRGVSQRSSSSTKDRSSKNSIVKRQSSKSKQIKLMRVRSKQRFKG